MCYTSEKIIILILFLLQREISKILMTLQSDTYCQNNQPYLTTLINN
jgi:hypothetical protein